MRFLTILCLMLVATKFGTSLAHVAELPGKLRLDEATYKAVQPIYYPGFTIGGLAEPAGLILTIILLLLTPPRTADFWLTLAALLGLVLLGLTAYMAVTVARPS